MKHSKIVHYRVQGRVSSEYKWVYWVVACGKKVGSVSTLTSIKENVTCKSCQKTAEFY